jgi:hypothetical protein
MLGPVFVCMYGDSMYEKYYFRFLVRFVLVVYTLFGVGADIGRRGLALSIEPSLVCTT